MVKYAALAELETPLDVAQANGTSIELGTQVFGICDGKELETLFKRCHQGKAPWDSKTPDELKKLLQEAEAEAVNARNDRLEMAVRSLAPVSRFLLQLHHENERSVDMELSKAMGDIYQMVTAKSGPFGPAAVYIPLMQQAFKLSLNMKKELDAIKEQLKMSRNQKSCRNCWKNKVFPSPNHSLAECEALNNRCALRCLKCHKFAGHWASKCDA